jgi:hypothetical protein
MVMADHLVPSHRMAQGRNSKVQPTATQNAGDPHDTLETLTCGATLVFEVYTADQRLPSQRSNAGQDAAAMQNDADRQETLFSPNAEAGSPISRMGTTDHRHEPDQGATGDGPCQPRQALCGPSSS